MKKLGLVLLIALITLVLVGCAPVGVANISGRGTVQTYDGWVEEGAFEPGEATFSLYWACYAQNNNRVEGKLNWNDPSNGVRISATLPEMSVSKFTQGKFTTCKALKAASANAEFSVNVWGTYSEDGNANGDAGTLTGYAMIFVSKPGAVDYCGPNGTAVEVAQMPTGPGEPVYAAYGCLDRGKITWGATQNQQ